MPCARVGGGSAFNFGDGMSEESLSSIVEAFTDKVAEKGYRVYRLRVSREFLSALMWELEHGLKRVEHGETFPADGLIVLRTLHGPVGIEGLL